MKTCNPQTMIKKYFLFVLFSFFISCNTGGLSDNRIITEIDKRITILNNSYKFSIIPENLQGKKFDTLKIYILKLYSSNNIVNNYEFD